MDKVVFYFILFYLIYLFVCLFIYLRESMSRGGEEEEGEKES